jgi:NAD(P)-dependent dehydrogenase (short-subunit alcohol dehydrogenase family)
VAVVTGAGSGIGRAVVARLAAEGAAVVGCDVNEAGLEETLGAIREGGNDATLVPADVTRQDQVDRLVDDAVGRHGRVGAIVNVASVAGLRGGGAGIAYTTSKHALVGMTRSIAWTYRGDGIRCNAICPGGVQTNIGTTAVPRSQFALERLGKSLALAEKAADPDEIAALASWLASDEASNVNGAIVPADGGWTAG